MQNFQLDVPAERPVSAKCAGRRLSRVKQVMQFTPDLVGLTIRELREENFWDAGDARPERPTVLTCDISHCHTPEQRILLAEALFDACVGTFGLDPRKLLIEFTQR